MSATLSTLDNILKEYYLGPVAEQLNNEVLLLNRLESRSEDLVGKYAYVPLHYGRSGGIGAVGENAALPDAGYQQYYRAKYDLKYLYGRVRVTGPSMAKTKNEAGAFLQALKSELDGLRNDLRKDLARQVYGDGSAVIAQAAASSAVSGSVITLASAEAIKKGQLYPNMKVDIFAYSTNAKASSVTTTITAVNAATPSITVADATGVADGDYIARAGAVAAQLNNATGSRSNEIDGLSRIVSTSAQDLGEVAVATYGWWDNKRLAPDFDPEVAGSQTALSLDLIQKAMNTIRLEGANPSAIITTLGIQREFYNLLQQDVQYIDPASLSYAAGFKTLSYNGMPLIADIDAPYGRMYVLDESTMKVFSDQDGHFLDADGQTLRQVSDRDAFEAIMVRYMNIGATKRNNQMVISGITVDGTTDAGV